MKQFTEKTVGFGDFPSQGGIPAGVGTDILQNRCSAVFRPVDVLQCPNTGLIRLKRPRDARRGLN